MSATDYLETAVLNALRGTPLDINNTYVKLHTGNPGETASANAAGNTERQAVSFGVPSGGTMASSAAVSWIGVSDTETYTHFSIWDAAVAGNALGYAALTTSKAISAGDDATFPTGLLTWTVA